MRMLICSPSVTCCVCDKMIVDDIFHRIDEKNNTVIPFYWKCMGSDGSIVIHEENLNKVKVYCSPACSLRGFYEDNNRFT